MATYAACISKSSEVFKTATFLGEKVVLTKATLSNFPI